MHKIIVDGEVVATVDVPRYIKVKPSTGAFVQAYAEKDAQGVAVFGTAYNLPGHTEIGYNQYDPAKDEWAFVVQPEARIIESDLAEDVYLKGQRLTKAEGNIGDAEDALTEMDEANDDRLAAIEDAICELDEKFGGAL